MSKQSSTGAECLARELRQLLGTAGQVVLGTILGSTRHVVTAQIWHENFPAESNFRKGHHFPICTDTDESAMGLLESHRPAGQRGLDPGSA